VCLCFFLTFHCEEHTFVLCCMSFNSSERLSFVKTTRFKRTLNSCDVCFNINIAPASYFPVCGGRDVCPLRVDHPHVDREYCLGCSICLAARDF
jgi:hypothetical protein